MNRIITLLIITVLTLASVAVPIKLVTFDTFPQEAGRKLALGGKPGA